MRLASVFALLLVLSAAPVAAGPRFDAINASGTLRVGLTGDYAPFSKLDPATGTYEGLDVDLARSLSRSLGLRLEIVPTSWPALSADLEAQKFDIAMGGVSVTEKRKAVGLFSVPMLSDGKAPIARCDKASRFQTLAEIDQPNVRVIVNPGGTNEKFARANIHKAQIILHPENVTIFDEIVAGRADVMMTDAIETRLQAKLHKELCAIHPDQPFDHADKAYFLTRDDALKMAVDKWLLKLKSSGDLKKQINHWVE
ncbi:MAG: transporter substrate-binding domain-containing protein [Parvibaculaceae bacterium]